MAAKSCESSGGVCDDESACKISCHLRLSWLERTPAAEGFEGAACGVGLASSGNVENRLKTPSKSSNGTLKCEEWLVAGLEAHLLNWLSRGWFVISWDFSDVSGCGRSVAALAVAG